MPRHIPATGINLFQLIYILMREYREKSGLEPLNLSLGNPDGIPCQEILDLKARFARDPGFEFHTYAEDTNLKMFAEGMVAIHAGVELTNIPGAKAIPIAGIKTATALLPLACAAYDKRSDFTVVSNLPAYDVIGTWSEKYLGLKRVAWKLGSDSNMRLDVAELKRILSLEKVHLVHVIRPGNPAAVGATRAEWISVGKLCAQHGVRLVNDAAYVGLSSDPTHVSLASVAHEVPGLEWMELYSVSKSFNDPGARLGVAVGTIDFIDDFILIKGNTDSGPNPGVMAAYGEFFKDRILACQKLEELKKVYEKRLAYIVPKLTVIGLRPAHKTEAGFFTLWKVPKHAFGEVITSAEHFNRLVIEKTGIVGVHFGATEPLIRYAVCTDVLNPQFQKRFEAEITKIRPEYDD